MNRNRTLPRHNISPRRVAILISALACAAGGTFALATALASPTQVSAYPIPGSRLAPPGAQISLRGVAAADLGKVVVTGSSSGAHTGEVRAHSDGHGGSFVPDRPFKPGETVTVATQLNVRGAKHGRFQFTVATPAGPIPQPPQASAGGSGGAALRFDSQPQLAPLAVSVTRRGSGSVRGDIFLAPQQASGQNGPMIIGQDGQLIWFRPLPKGTQATDFRVQRYHQKPVLTWWQGTIASGVGVGEDVILNSSYHQIATVHAADGLSADLHEFQLTARGTALITAYYPVYWDASAVGAAQRQIVLDSVVQEIDVKTGLLLFQWDSLDHIPLSHSYTQTPEQANQPIDYFHANSVDEDREGNLVISARNTWAAYKVDRGNGSVKWTLGGKHSSFTMGNGTSFAFQHDVRIQAANDGLVTLFDDGGGLPRAHDQSRGLTLKLDLNHMTATLASELQHNPALPANFEGNVQQLPDGGSFVGWGEQPYFTEFDRDGRLVLDGRFDTATPHYRAYLLPWTGTPSTAPAISASSRGTATTVYASWNGATNVASWQVLAGDSTGALAPVTTANKDGFETSIKIEPHRYVAVQALDDHRRVLATSPAVQPH